MSCKDKSSIGPMRVRRLWNDPANAVDEYLQAFAVTHPGTMILPGSRAILRRDHAQMQGRVKLLSGGGAGNEPTHAGFVGPGMLTAAVVGDVFSAPPSDSILKVIRELGSNHSPGVLLIVQNYTGYRINFGLARLRAQSEGLLVGMLTIGDDTCLKSFDKTAGRRGLAGTLFIHKIAGAMAEGGKAMGEIYAVCSKIMSSGEIATIGLCTRVPPKAGICSCTVNLGDEQMELGFGIHGEPAVSRVPFTTAKEAVSQLIDVMTDETADACLKLGKPDDPDLAKNEIALIINNLGGSSQLELGVFASEVIQQLTSRGLHVERTYVGTLITSLDTIGFQFSVLKLSSDSNLKTYLDAPTAAPAWPKILDISALGPNWIGDATNMEADTLRRCSEIGRESGIPEVEPCGPVLDERTAQVFLIILTFACEALTSCTEQLNIMDQDSGDGDCGTSIARGTKAIRAAIKDKQIIASRPFVTLRQISYIIERVMGGIIGGLYSLFFDAGAKEFAKRSRKDPVDACMWLNALAAGNKAIMEYGQANVGDRTMLDPLLTAQDHLANALNTNLHPIRAFGDAVKAAESRAIETIKMPARVGRASLVRCKRFEYPDPGAHAVGIWMRAAYEGVKLKMSCQCEDKHLY